jgi:hypothetical protein
MPIKGQSPKQVVHTEMHKFKHGTLHSGSKHGPLVKSRKQAIAIALSESGQSKRKRGGHYAEGGGTGGDLPDVGEPTIPSGGQFSPGLPAVNKAADIASQLGGNAVISAATLPYRYPKAMIDAAMTQPGSEEAHQAYGDVGNVTGEMGLNMIGPKGGVPEGSSFGVMVGPYGARELLKSKSLEAQITHGMADQLAQEALARGEKPYDVWKQYGWSTGTEGKPRKEIPDIGAKLVPVTKDGVPSGYKLLHPAGDFHKIYNIPPIQFDPATKKGEASFNPVTRQILIGGKPTKTNMKESMPQVLHEVQHAIQEKEGFPFGDHPARLMGESETNAMKVAGLTGNPLAKKPPRNEFDQEYVPPEHPLPSWQVDKIKKQIREKAGVDPESEQGKAMLEYASGLLQNRIELAKQLSYERSAGETEARNVQNRYRNKNYSEYPEFTEDVPRGLQFVRYRAVGGPVGNQKVPYRDKSILPRTGDQAIELDPNVNDLRSEDRNRVPPNDIPDQDQPQMPKRFQFGGFNPEKAMSIGLARKAGGMGGGSGGLLKSQIPGRTDQIQASIPKGAYIIPADVVSGMGQGNTDAGGAILGKLMNRGPYNMNLPRGAGNMRGPRHSSLKFSSKQHFAEGGQLGFPLSGGDAGEPVLAAGGEYVVLPHEVAALGAGDVDTGHNILDAFVKHMREKTIQTMRKLPGPKGAKT